MPLVRISLLKGRTPTQLRAIADNVHDALVEAYGVPATDRFQVIDERDPGSLIYSHDYLDIERTDGIVLILRGAGAIRRPRRRSIVRLPTSCRRTRVCVPKTSRSR